MTITFRRDVLNEILKRRKPFVLTGGNPERFDETSRGILLEKTDLTTVEVTALDGHMLIHLTVEVESQAETGSMVIPVVKPFGRSDDYVTVEEDEHYTTFVTMSGRTSVPKLRGTYIDWRRAIPRSPETKCNTIYMDPMKIKRAMDGFTAGKAVKIEIIDPWRGGIMLRDQGGAFALILPVNPSKADF